tara:strand:+ start:254 stop:559 length:306 start_codon:yes stop_codon:yes gene_type:complete
MYKFLPIFLLLALTGCSSSPEDQLKACVIGGSKMMVDNMKKDPKMAARWDAKAEAKFDAQVEKMEAMSWEEMLNGDSSFMAKVCLDHKKNKPELFKELVSY